MKKKIQPLIIAVFISILIVLGIILGFIVRKKKKNKKPTYKYLKFKFEFENGDEHKEMDAKMERRIEMPIDASVWKDLYNQIDVFVHKYSPKLEFARKLKFENGKESYNSFEFDELVSKSPNEIINVIAYVRPVSIQR